MRNLLSLFALLAAALAIGLVFRYPLVTDDPFITYRYARNLSQGVGFVYNPGAHVLSTTTPLYALVLAALGFFDPDIPALGYWGSVISYGGAAYFLYMLAGAVKRRGGGVVGGAVLLFAPALVMTFGLETGFYLMLGLAAVLAYVRGRVTLALALAALLTLTRNDGVLLAALLGSHYVWSRRERLKLPGMIREPGWLSPFAIYLLILLPWLIFAWLYFGSPFPFTLAAKIAQAESGLWDPFAVGLYKWARDNLLWLAPLAGFALVGAGWAVRRRSLVLLGGAWALLHLAAYSALRVAFYPWYVAPLIPALALFAGLGIEAAAEWVAGLFRLRFLTRAVRNDGDDKVQSISDPPFSSLVVQQYENCCVPRTPSRWLSYQDFSTQKGAPIAQSHHVVALVRLVTGALVVLFAVFLVGLELRADVAVGMTRPAPKVEAYTSAAEWLAQNTAPGASVDALEVGVIGYYDARRTVDFVGLVDPERIPYLRMRRFADGVRRAAADYVIAIPPDTWLPQDVWFKDAYRAVKRIHVKGFYSNQPLVIYERAGVGQTPVETRTLNAGFERRIELESVDLYARTVARGDVLPVRLHLRTRDTQPIPEEWKFTLQLIAPGDRVVAQTDNFYPARLPEDDKPFTDYQGVPIPSTAPPGAYDLILAMYDVNKNERLSFYDASGNEAGDLIALGAVKIR